MLLTLTNIDEILPAVSTSVNACRFLVPAMSDSLVVDDVLPPWQPRAVEVRGEASALDSGGKAIMEGFDDPIIRIRPRRIVSWGLEDGFQARSVG